MALVDFWKDELSKTISHMKNWDDETLLDNLIYANRDYQDYLNRDDYIIWSQEDEKIVGEIYYTIREEVLYRMAGCG